MTPRAILILAMACFALAYVLFSAASRKDADAIGHVETERDVSILRGGSSHGSNGRRKPGTLVAPTQGGVAPAPLNLSDALHLAHAHRTNRVWLGVRTGVNLNRFPLIEP